MARRRISKNYNLDMKWMRSYVVTTKRLNIMQLISASAVERSLFKDARLTMLPRRDASHTASTILAIVRLVHFGLGATARAPGSVGVRAGSLPSFVAFPLGVLA